MIPKRAMSAFLATVFSLALLLSFRTPGATSLVGSSTDGSDGSAIVGVPTMPEPTTSSSAAPTPAASAPAGGAAATYVDGTVTGPVVSTRYGDVQVQVTISGGSVVDVTALTLPSGDGHSRQISQAVEPMLRDEALAAQDASIDTVSGATYTSRAYRSSLQAALDAAHA